MAFHGYFKLYFNLYRKNGIWQNKQGIIAFPPTVFMKQANRNGRFNEFLGSLKGASIDWRFVR
jgi:hypothetical protein